MGYFDWGSSILVASNCLDVQMFIKDVFNRWFSPAIRLHFFFSPLTRLLMVSIGIVINIYFVVIVLKLDKEMYDQQIASRRKQPKSTATSVDKYGYILEILSSSGAYLQSSPLYQLVLNKEIWKKDNG